MSLKIGEYPSKLISRIKIFFSNSFLPFGHSVNLSNQSAFNTAELQLA